LRDHEGYNNGVTLLNSICRAQYSNESMEIKARNLNILDIEILMNYKGKNQRDNYTSDGTKYGKTKQYTLKNWSYPILYEQERGVGIHATEVNKTGLGLSDNSELLLRVGSPAFEGNIITTQTYYDLNGREKDFFDETVYNMLFKTNNYWISSRFTDNNSGNICLGIRNIYKEKLSRKLYEYSDSND